MIELFFWSSLFLILYCYFLYPVLISLIGTVMRKNIRKENIVPTVSLVIAAYNEQSCIQETLRNKLLLSYDRDRLEIIVVSDASTDQTDEIVRTFTQKGVKLVRQEPRQGKTAALNNAVSIAKGDIVFFADANSIWDENVLIRIVSNFADPQVGYVTGKMVYVNKESNIIGDGCGVYMKYENILRKLETMVGSVVGVDGGIDAMRRCLFEPIRQDLLPDFVLPLKVIEKGYRVAYEPGALLKEEPLDNTTDEFKMRVRVTLRSLHALWYMRHLCNPMRYLLFSWQLLSHKLLRYMIWIFLIFAFIANIFLIEKRPVYTLIFLSQVILYCLAALGAVLEMNKNPNLSKLVFVPYYFMLVNFSSAVAFFKFLKKEKTVIWQPRKG
jgi:cellulose synthase/poly-beta-1,6-N-acetylglucosamine synthase-like glycosyltransferase